ncbi:uncharacterized protein FA14DRAFT_180362 [Meira miltonrushii]|uniref:Uncharacterized protein n=1 Tax=Meira miltonrushii TaxID=1280837 RepID=A0A316V8A1_9BASI|nr:uncharacterized protein FA14DRAFT_180362 [Meira miltonrushii]PWN33726.1 hypothetical protein FA14DRAFT_180362 [Meira miltonrushii]
MTKKFIGFLTVLLCAIVVSSFDTVISSPVKQSGSDGHIELYRRSPGNGIFHSNVARNRIDIATKAKGRSASAYNLFRQGNVSKAVGRAVTGAIGQHPVMQGAIARGRAARQAYVSRLKRK